MSRVFVGIVQTIVVTVANVNSRYAVAIVAREQITKTRAALRLTIFRRFIRSIAAVIIAVAIPCGRNASVIRTPKAIGWTRPLRTVHWILVAVITAIVVAVA